MELLFAVGADTLNFLHDSVIRYEYLEKFDQCMPLPIHFCHDGTLIDSVEVILIYIQCIQF